MSLRKRGGISWVGGIDDFRWHDPRHTSWHVQKGTPPFALQELGGWESAEMLRRYAHLAADHLTPYARRLGALRAVVEAHVDGTNSSQGWKNEGPASLQALDVLVGRVGIEPTTNGLRVAAFVGSTR